MPTSVRFSLPRPRTLVLSAIIVALVLIGMTASATPAQAAAPLLIGMGDSYTTGAGIPPVDESSGLCQRSARAYPLVAADELGFDGQNMACGGAVLADFSTPSRRGAPPQITNVAGANVIAFTIGGNDVGGPDGVLDSSRSGASMADFAASVDALAPQLLAAYTDVQRAAPRAQIFVLGYPDIVPRTQERLRACLGARGLGLTADNIHRSIGRLNAAIAAAAATAGAVFVDTTPSFVGHEMCTAQPYANAPQERAPASAGGAMHPNELGHMMMAAALIAAIGGSNQPGARPGPPPGRPIPGPPIPVPPIPVPPIVGPPIMAIPLTPEERAVVQAIAEALLDRIRETVDRLGLNQPRLPGGPTLPGGR